MGNIDYMASSKRKNLDLFQRKQLEKGTSPLHDAPLAERMRPASIDEFLGQEEILAPGAFLHRAIQEDQVPSIILWGPPGSGKTSLARVIAQHTKAHFEIFSAVLGGIKEVRGLVAEAENLKLRGQRTILFVDEIHRFNKSQQDGFLPHVERGTITLIGATTENPSFTLNNALLSRCRVIPLKPLARQTISSLLKHALDDELRGLGSSDIHIPDDVIEYLSQVADGDGRRGLGLLEQTTAHAQASGLKQITLKDVQVFTERSPLAYSRKGDDRYDLISAFIKSMRGSDPQAALYYGARMIEAGEDPRFLLRRLVIFASEDIGNADPRALQISLAGSQAYEQLGLPEGLLSLAQSITYCATAPKSNASYKAWKTALNDAREYGNLPVPDHLKNAPTSLAKELGHGKGYQYPHDHPEHFINTSYLPRAIHNKRYYRPTKQGYERHIQKRMEDWWGDDTSKTDESNEK